MSQDEHQLDEDSRNAISLDEIKKRHPLDDDNGLPDLSDDEEINDLPETSWKGPKPSTMQCKPNF
jgi:hypothetical protein